jgi:hypothetical protein
MEGKHIKTIEYNYQKQHFSEVFNDFVDLIEARHPNIASFNSAIIKLFPEIGYKNEIECF